MPNAVDKPRARGGNSGARVLLSPDQLITNHLASSQPFIVRQADADLTDERILGVTGGLGMNLSINATQENFLLANYADYVPTVKQSGTLAAITVTRARYVQFGKTVHFVVYTTVVTATGAVAGNDVQIALPVAASAAAAANADVIGVGQLYDASANLVYPCVAFIYNVGTGFAALQPTGAGQAPGFLGTVGFTAAMAVSDSIRISGTYEAA